MLRVVKTMTTDLEIGMYVSKLDRSWEGTPFLLQGFRIETAQEIEQLQTLCVYVHVDVQQSIAKVRTAIVTASGKKKSPPLRDPIKSQLFMAARRTAKYPQRVAFSSELPVAKVAYSQLADSVGKIFGRSGNLDSFDIRQVKLSVKPMIESICRNPDACLWLARLKKQDDYTYQHSVAASIWAVALGRQIGLGGQDLQSLAVGGLLFDVGKLGVDSEILRSSRRLSGEELERVRAHVSHGARMVADLDVSDDVRDMVLSHHERYDGSGYPQGLRGDEIPVFARIAAVVDSYDAITSHRPYGRAVSPSEGIRFLDENRDVLFQAEIVDEFIQAVGVYPAGTLVLLSSGEVGVVVADGKTQRLRPRIAVLLDSDKNPVNPMRTIDLREETEDEHGNPLNIRKTLEPDAFGLNLNNLVS